MNKAKELKAVIKGNIRVKTIKYYGVVQGYKVIVNGKKYPINRGCFYGYWDIKKIVRNINERF